MLKYFNFVIFTLFGLKLQFIANLINYLIKVQIIGTFKTDYKICLTNNRLNMRQINKNPPYLQVCCLASRVVFV